MNSLSLANPSSAADRLAQSREGLRQALQAETQVKKPADDSPNLSETASTWLESLQKTPGLALIADAANAWWAQHPARTAALLGAEAAKTLVQPIAQRNPLGLLAGAAAFGALLAWSRPWRWVLTPAVLAGLVPQIASKVIAQVPPKNWINLIAAMAADSGKNPKKNSGTE